MGKANGKFVQLALLVPQQCRQAKGAVRQAHFLVKPGLAHRVALAASNICIVQHQLLHIGKLSLLSKYSTTWSWRAATSVITLPWKVLHTHAGSLL